jgi:hypothetical protein
MVVGRWRGRERGQEKEKKIPGNSLLEKFFTLKITPL